MTHKKFFQKLNSYNTLADMAQFNVAFADSGKLDVLCEELLKECRIRRQRLDINTALCLKRYVRMPLRFKYYTDNTSLLLNILEQHLCERSTIPNLSELEILDVEELWFDCFTRREFLFICAVAAGVILLLCYCNGSFSF